MTGVHISKEVLDAFCELQQGQIRYFIAKIVELVTHLFTLLANYSNL